jgi:hypothetical protein
MPILPGRHTARIDGDFVVFLIGMRINEPWRVHKWLPVARAMPAMLAELARRPELGLLHVDSWLGGLTVQTVQYWRSFDHLHAYAHAKDLSHLPAWAAFNRRARGNKAVGIYHETYLVSAGQYECIHVNMPRMGLLRACEAVPVDGRTESARQRLEPGPTNPVIDPASGR